jgi:large subunit ribosomal protein L11
MAKKEIIDQFKIMAPGGSATPAPPLGPVLGAKGVNPGQFIQKFNAATAALKGKVVGCVVTVYNDKSFALEIKSSPASVLIKEAAGLRRAPAFPTRTRWARSTRPRSRRSPRKSWRI